MSARQQVKDGRKALPLNLIAQAVPFLTRSELAALADRLIDALDSTEPDPDLEDDDPAGQYDEDTYTGRRPKGYGAGCAISDPDAEHDGAEEEQGYARAHYQVDQSLMTSPLMSRQYVFEDTVL